MSRVTYMNESCHIYENESWYTRKRVRGARMNESCHTYE